MTEQDYNLLKAAVDWVDEETGLYITVVQSTENPHKWEPELRLPVRWKKFPRVCALFAKLREMRTQRRGQTFPTRAEAYLAAYRVVLAHNKEEE